MEQPQKRIKIDIRHVGYRVLAFNGKKFQQVEGPLVSRDAAQEAANKLKTPYRIEGVRVDYTPSYAPTKAK